MKAIERHVLYVKAQPWGEEMLLVTGPTYTMKRLHYLAGKAGGLQYHINRTESFFVESGEAIVRYDRGDGTLVEVRVVGGGEACHIPAGAPHQFEAVTDCIVFEASTLGLADRVNVAAYYGRTMPEGTLPTTWTEEEIAAFERTAAAHQEGLVVSP